MKASKKHSARDSRAEVANMRVSVEITGRLGRRLTIVVPTEEVEAAVKSRIQRAAQSARIDGFRPGKVPVNVMEQKYGQAIRYEVVDELINSSLTKTILQEKMQPAEKPVIQSFKADLGMPLEYTVAFEVLPDVQVPSLAGATLEKLVVSIEEEDVNRVLEQIRKQHVQWKEVNRPAEKGDRLTLDVQSFRDGKRDNSPDKKGVFLVLDDSAIALGFSKAINSKVGDEIDVPLIEEKKENTPSQNVSVKVTIHKIEAPELPVLDDAFGELFGIKEGGLDAVRREVRTQMEQQLESVLKDNMRRQVLDLILKRHPIELPKAMVDEECQRLEKDMLNHLKKNSPGLNANSLTEAERTRLMDSARQRVSLGLLLPAFVKENEMKVDEARLSEQIGRILNSFENPSQFLQMLQENKNLQEQLRTQILEEQVIERLSQQAQLIEKVKSYAEVMNLREAEHVHDENCVHEHEH